MIFSRSVDGRYRRWFAWRPVRLHGPDEWDRKRATGKPARWVWLQVIWRMRSEFGTYYALGD